MKLWPYEVFTSIVFFINAYTLTDSGTSFLLQNDEKNLVIRILGPEVSGLYFGLSGIILLWIAYEDYRGKTFYNMKGNLLVIVSTVIISIAFIFAILFH